ncbi:Transcription initiation factor TFIID subunit 7 [Acropora cervicornis]|uniref:Transcription initiation factor TFIID subunit 7 n=1 Tax=Acropora cervicornis TaxID=6130 RepID=A0AAD9PW10_ACRCE|nr:Transcription initiation factor TFIID subunit 7 [Acropora cervicornis]
MSSKSKFDGNELEKQFILRVPQVYASALQHAIQNGSLRDRLSIEFQVRFDGAALSAKMLVCSEDDNTKEEEDISPKKESKRFVWNHGITGPLKNVRKRRFRKTAKKKLVESPEIEKEVKRLLRTDLSASNVNILFFEVIQDEEKPDENVVSDAELLNNSMPSPLPGTNTEEQDGVGSDDEDRNELFAILQEASSDEQDDGDTQEEDDNEVNVDVELEEESQFAGDKLC